MVQREYYNNLKIVLEKNMFNSSLSCLLSRLTVNSVIVPTKGISLCSPLAVKVTNILYGEPLRKKKRLDPGIIKAREERKKKKLEKQIRRLEKHAKQLKPVIELEPPTAGLREKMKVKRELPALSYEELEERALLHKDWAKYKVKLHRQDVQAIDGMMFQQQRALDNLKAISEDLYLEAIQIDPTLLPYSAKGPTLTPPSETYDSPDGDYSNVTRKFDGE